MDIVISQELGKARVTVLSLRGDLASEHEMEAFAQGLIVAGARHVVIDLAEIRCLASIRFSPFTGPCQKLHPPSI